MGLDFKRQKYGLEIQQISASREEKEWFGRWRETPWHHYQNFKKRVLTIGCNRELKQNKGYNASLGFGNQALGFFKSRFSKIRNQYGGRLNQCMVRSEGNKPLFD